ncbi:MAG TPA: ADP-ribosylglycohydrolase family protein [Bacillota bacterium]|nr:ADP-ribosylglycohydrolase family protein [Bacillota bacterium]HOK68839.1 ADP-ribosylglycohydrolase family protein [Bacillota bacterium]HPP85812.1 ADP-ribosylglycohydrolase family protein [Bacillota bacterium]
MQTITLTEYRDKLKAAMLARFAGCTLGAPVEGWSLQQMEDYAKQLGLAYPLTDYWPAVPNPDDPRYIYEKFSSYCKGNFSYVPCDDDVGYTLLSLFIAEEGNGRDFTLNDVAKAWVKYITLAWTAEDIALKNLKNGVPPEKAAEIDNPYDEWIGADIRCDGYGYMAPCEPEKAAEMAKTDAWISHRRNGVYGSMYFAAVIALSFQLSDAKKALTAGLDYIPSDCELADAIRWALENYDAVRDYRHAAELVDERFPGMHAVHTINNACLTVFALALGGKDIGKVISNAVAMAHDCDCTAATAGSIAGACYGMKCLDSHWYEPFGDKIGSYFNGERYYSINDILDRYEKQALKGGRIVIE